MTIELEPWKWFAYWNRPFGHVRGNVVVRVTTWLNGQQYGLERVVMEEVPEPFGEELGASSTAVVEYGTPGYEALVEAVETRSKGLFAIERKDLSDLFAVTTWRAIHAACGVPEGNVL